MDVQGVTQSNVEDENLDDHRGYRVRNAKRNDQEIIDAWSTDTQSASEATSKSMSESRTVRNTVVQVLCESDHDFNSYFIAAGDYYDVCYGSSYITSHDAVFLALTSF